MNRSEILEGIRNKIGKEKLFGGNSFRRSRCSADFTGISEEDRVVVDLDKVFPVGQKGENQCECILFYFDHTGNFVVVPIELKGGKKNTKVGRAVQQLKGGADFADAYVPCGFKSICHPVLFQKRSLSTSEFRQLKKPQSKVCLGGRSFEIKTARCGRKLADVL